MESIARESGVDTTCAAFIDGTVRPICRPVRFQRQAYTGHKRVHSLKFQIVTLANGLIMAIYGPVERRRHDIVLLRSSDIGAKWQACAPPGMFIYGDPAYPLRDWLSSPYKGSKITAPQSRFNSKMSSVRVSVEWCFGEVLRYWAFLDFMKNLKVFLSPVAKLYLIGVFFTNCLNCARQGNQTSRFFHLMPPPLKRYLNQ
ncbi:hypothetical protein Ae201684P_007059 [Aphanomyces euteiches]|uniref:DDE Tnp4 domain-containing protein n=1 Tax=Aphanomyces euteiches TaxID=100861 RepID=A0A6G0WVD3_9STRA|nr:hypothetical protein Ae201684_011331 [Aphanomyces euteiches]KAH9100868.1 hypothetical protein Ae201684P_007059 [Aphanomyces euteiches]